MRRETDGTSEAEEQNGACCFWDIALDTVFLLFTFGNTPCLTTTVQIDDEF